MTQSDIHTSGNTAFSFITSEHTVTRTEDAKSPAEAPKSPKRSKRYHDDQADLQIITSDGVLFRVWAYHLQAGS